MVERVYRALLRRSPSINETERWSLAFQRGKSFYDLFNAVADSKEYERKRGVETAYPPGHYYSPVVDPSTVAQYVADQRKLTPPDIPGVALSTEAMLALWKSALATIHATHFPDQAEPTSRFHYNNGSFPFGDAIMLRAMIARLRPKRIIEVGSGYTTACALDTLDDLGLSQTMLTCIEPFADRLRGLLRPHDWARVQLIETGVQAVAPHVFDELAEGDILFIDSTHVAKTGSDVHFEMFQVLPRLKAGVTVHFHDVPYPFEYPDSWIFASNLSWNEAYFLRAFLMYNATFEVVMWNSLLARTYGRIIADDFPLFLKNPGSSIWIERRSPRDGSHFQR